jgi:hypothetical protein
MTILSKPSNDKFRENFDNIFGSRNNNKDEKTREEFPRLQFIIRQYKNGATEIIDTIECARKTTYANGDVIYMKEENVLAIKPHDFNGRMLTYTADALDETRMIDYVQLKPLSIEAKKRLTKRDISKNPDRFIPWMQKLFDGWKIETRVDRKTVLKFFGM